jgi:hypothetical protein
MDQNPLHFMQTQGKLQNEHHQKWSTYLQQFYLNINYKKWSTNNISNFLNKPPVVALTMLLDSCGHETSRWSQLYASDPDLTTTYQMLGTCNILS